MMSDRSHGPDAPLGLDLDQLPEPSVEDTRPGTPVDLRRQPPSDQPGVMEMPEQAFAAPTEDIVDVREALIELLRLGGSDLLLTVGAPPIVRLLGDELPLEGWPVLRPDQLQRSLYALIDQNKRRELEEDHELDFAMEIPGRSRFRVNFHHQRGSIGAVFRAIPLKIQSLEMLNMPPMLGDLIHRPNGLVLVTGPTGSGKSSTLAAIIDRANRTQRKHIVTIEDPIEFVHEHKMSVITQREVGTDTHSFSAALKRALRQDPDIILVGEMRDRETIEAALIAAETGHQVFGTLHTSSASSTVARIVGIFPANQQDQIRMQLAGTLEAVVCQTLCKTATGTGRMPAMEIMLATPGIRSNIRDNKIHQIDGALETGRKLGMQTMDWSLAQLVKQDHIKMETAVDKANSVDNLNAHLAGR